MVAAVKFSGDNFICAGESGDSTYACDKLRLCVKSVVSHRVQEMTLDEASTIRDCLDRAIAAISARQTPPRSPEILPEP